MFIVDVLYVLSTFMNMGGPNESRIEYLSSPHSVYHWPMLGLGFEVIIRILPCA